MKKIRISTVKQTCDAQVINIDAALVANAVRAQLCTKEMYDWIEERKTKQLDENGNEVDATERVIRTYNIKDKHAIELIDTVYQFVNNLANAFLEDE